MKKLIYFTLYLFYKYYNKGSSRTIAYEASIMALSFLIFMNLFALTILFSVNDDVYNFIRSDNGFMKIIKISILLLPPIITLRIFFKKANIIELKYEKTRIKNGNIFLLSYILISFIAIVVLAMKDKLF